jgi:hypothetical protein
MAKIISEGFGTPQDRMFSEGYTVNFPRRSQESTPPTPPSTDGETLDSLSVTSLKKLTQPQLEMLPENSKRQAYQSLIENGQSNVEREFAERLWKAMDVGTQSSFLM